MTAEQLHRMEGHTAGDWLVETDQTPDGSSLYVIDRDGQRIVCDCDGRESGQHSVEAAEANARLCASAPRLLAERNALLAASKVMANRIAVMMSEYTLPEECNGIICGELDAINSAIALAES